MRVVVLLALVFCTFASAQVVVSRFVIDDFRVAQGQNAAVTLSQSVNTNNGSLPVVQDSSIYIAGCTGLVGCARDLRVQVNQGYAGRVFGVNVSSVHCGHNNCPGEYLITTPQGGRSINTIQYDGNDGSMNLNINGLQGSQRDFTVGGLATGLRFTAVSDLPSVFYVQMFSPNSADCIGILQFPVKPSNYYNKADITVDIPYSSFSGDCQFTNIGAVQIQVPSENAVPAAIRLIEAIGFENGSPSRTVTPSPSPISLSTVDRFVIDDFTVGQGQRVEVTLSSNLDTNDPRHSVIMDSSISAAGCSGLIGCARDIRLQAYTGFAGHSFVASVLASSSVFGYYGEFAVSTPKGGKSVTYLQYDGNDGSFNLNVNGLPSNERDFTDGGLATALRVAAMSDNPTTYVIRLISPFGGGCTGSLTSPALPGAYTESDVISDISFTEFTGDCDFTNIGAVQVEIPTYDATDLWFWKIGAIGLPGPSSRLAQPRRSPVAQHPR